MPPRHNRERRRRNDTTIDTSIEPLFSTPGSELFVSCIEQLADGDGGMDEADVRIGLGEVAE